MTRFRSFLATIEQRDFIIVRCPFRTFLGVRCPGCGMTHALVAMARGEFRRAVGYNPFVILLAPLLVWGILDFITRALDRLKELRAR